VRQIVVGTDWNTCSNAPDLVFVLGAIHCLGMRRLILDKHVPQNGGSNPAVCRAITQSILTGHFVHSVSYSVLGTANGALSLSDCLVRSAFSFGLGIAGDLTSGFLDRTSRLIDGSLYTILIHRQPPYW
jgi:hypothetical protein